jgi:hypothetical protein
LALGDPIIANYTDRDGRREQHVFFLTTNGSLQQSFWTGTGWYNQSLPGTLGRLLGLANHGAFEQHVYFVAIDGTLRQTFWNGSGWYTQILPTASPPT